MIPTAINYDHLLTAIEYIREHGVPARRASRNYTLLYNGEKYPPKYVVAKAAEFATGQMLDSESFGGGKETNRFLSAMGFRVIDSMDVPAVYRAESRKDAEDPIKPHDERCGECKNVIADMLRVLYGPIGVIKHEHRLKISTAGPRHDGSEGSIALNRIYEQLQSHRGFQDFVFTKNLRPSDLFIADLDFLVELDESQHHTLARAEALAVGSKTVAHSFTNPAERPKHTFSHEWARVQ